MRLDERAELVAALTIYDAGAPEEVWQNNKRVILRHLREAVREAVKERKA